MNRLAKQAAGPLSRLVCSRRLQKPVRVLDAYANFLVGKGAGTGAEVILRSEMVKPF